jgi:hypothetical protein
MFRRAKAMMKTFDKTGKVTRAARESRFPRFIAYIDFKAACEAGTYAKAMVETDLIDAMRTLENAANKYPEDVYLCGIYQKTDGANDAGEPLYEMVIGARMGEERLGGWHAWDGDHGETPHTPARWYSRDFARDGVEEWDRRGFLEG